MTPRPYRLGRHPRRTDHPALLNADGTVAATFAYNASREDIISSLEHAGLVLHADDTVTPDGDKPKEGGEIAAAFAANSLPSVTPKAIEIGRQLAKAESAYRAFEPVLYARFTDAQVHTMDQRTILDDRVESLRTLLTTIPAESIADAAVLLAECVTMAARLAGSAHNPRMAEQCADKLERMLMSALPHVAEAAGLDMAEMGWAEQDALRIARYAGVGVQQ